MSDKSNSGVIHLHPDKNVRIDETMYHSEYEQSVQNTQAFWNGHARRVLTWIQDWDNVCVGDFNSEAINWFVNGQLNACYNCVDRHLAMHPDRIALIWEGSNPEENQQFTYLELYDKVCRFANVLRAKNVKKGDRVGIYLPMIPELVFAMLACARIGAIHTVVFSGFSADALQLRMQDTECALLITADESIRGEKSIPLKKSADQALQECPNIKHVIVVRRTGGTIPWVNGRDAWYHDLVQTVTVDCPIEIMDSSEPLFILYTSGSTGKPKGIVHSTGGYMVYAALTYQVVFDHRENDVLFCTADPGWITGHTYLVYGPLANGTTTLLFEGVPNFPTHARYWQIIDKYQVTTFYTSPTALRSLRAAGDQWVAESQRKSLRLLGSVGEPIGAEIWLWYYQVVGKARCPILNTWWQTETGGIVMSALPGDTKVVPGAAGVPFWGIQFEIVDDNGHVVQNEQPGRLVLTQPWPGLMQTIFGDRKRFVESYLKPVSGCYLTGDIAYRDHNGNVIIPGRDDDVIKVSGHRFGSEELETALVSYPGVSEAAVVGLPDAEKGHVIVAYVTLMPNVAVNETLQQALKQQVRTKIGAIATPDHIYWAPGLPKTRSGKIMRRILRKIAAQDFDNLGDTSTLVDPSVIDQLIAGRKKLN